MTHPKLTVAHWLLCAGCIIGLATASLFVWQVYRTQLSEQVLSKVDRLALSPPPGKSELEWAVHVYWTHNLHCAAMPQIKASYSDLRKLNLFLDGAIETGPDDVTIAALWDRYAAISDSGARYRKRFEPQRDADARLMKAEDYENVDKQSYQILVDSVRERDHR